LCLVPAASPWLPWLPFWHRLGCLVALGRPVIENMTLLLLVGRFQGDKNNMGRTRLETGM
jgi:hypothetical protein